MLPRTFFARPALEVAPELLGCLLHVGEVSLRLTEVEAYAGTDDPGSHGYRGLTPRTEVMFGPAGHLYCYLSYGMHSCANVVCGDEGTCAAVLLRAGEVVAGEELVAERRSGIARRDWSRGPGRLTVAAGIALGDNGIDLCVEDPALRRVWIAPPAEPVDATRVRTGPRVGVSGPGGDATAYPWRFWLDGEPSVSAYRPGRVSACG